MLRSPFQFSPNALQFKTSLLNNYCINSVIPEGLVVAVHLPLQSSTKQRLVPMQRMRYNIRKGQRENDVVQKSSHTTYMLYIYRAETYYDSAYLLLSKQPFPVQVLIEELIFSAIHLWLHFQNMFCSVLLCLTRANTHKIILAWSNPEACSGLKVRVQRLSPQSKPQRLGR